MTFAAVSCLVETLEYLQRFTFLALEINSLQMKIRPKQPPDNRIRHSVHSAAENMSRFWKPMMLKYLQTLPAYPKRNPSSLDQSQSLLKVMAREISDLCRVLCFVLSFLRDFESISHDREKMQDLEGRLVNLTHSMEDTIEESLFDHSIISKAFNFINGVMNEDPMSMMGEVSFMTQVLEMFDKRRGIQLHIRQASMEIDIIKGIFQRIYEESEMVTENLKIGESKVSADSVQHIPTKKIDIDDGLLSVLDRVIRDSSPIESVAIVGMGGVGKTTLAQRIFEYPLTCHHFYIRAWVMVSQVYQVRNLFIGLLRSINQETNEMHGKSNEQLAEELYRSLKGRRFLVVLDNIWSTKVWDDVKRCFPDDKNGSRVLLTTRLMKVADYVNPKQPPHYVNLLDTDKSWMLLQQKVFGEEPCPFELEDVGRRIAKKSQGLPLVIVLIAGIICKITRTRECWECIAESVSSIVSRDPEQCLEVLALSYKHLPNHLKACFLYMGAFPEDCEIEVQKLIRLWIAEGFLDKRLSLSSEDVKLFLLGNINERLRPSPPHLQSGHPNDILLRRHDVIRFPLISRSMSSLELEAESYLEDLIDRNLVLIGKKSFNGKIRTVRLHEIVQDLCIREAQKEKFMHVIRRDSKVYSAGMTNPRRLILHSNFWDNLHSLPPMKLVRSFLCFSLGFGTIPYARFFYLGFKLLKVLDIIFLPFQSFPVQILQLVHLRYLAFTCTYELPISISELKNLQTLIIHGPWIHDEFGDSPILLLEYWDMPWLRHLHTSVACHLRNPFIAKGDFLCPLRPQYLQSLSIIMFSSCSQEVFSLMPRLKKLGIFECEQDYRTDMSSKWLSNLVHLNQLEALKCSFYAQNKIPRNNLHWLLPSSLKKLNLRWSYVPWKNMTPVAMLPNLEVLKLKDHAFQGPEWEPSAEGFRCLKHLLIENHDLVRLEATRIHFPCLEHLALRSCKSLEEIPFGVADIPTMQLIELHHCSESAENSAKEIQEQTDGLNVDIRSDRS